MADIPYQWFPTAATYREWRSGERGLGVARPPLVGPGGFAYEGALGAYLDGVVARLFDAVNARKPSQCPEDGLYLLGAERGIESFGAPASVYRERLRTAWTIWSLAGTRPGIVSVLSWIGCGNTTVYSRAEWPNPPPAGPLAVRAFARDSWSSFDVLVRKPNPWKERRWGDWRWGDGTWGSTATAEEIATLRRVIRTYSSGHEIPVYAYLRFGRSAVWGDWRWGDGRVWGGDGGTMSLVIGVASWVQRGLVNS